MPDFHDRRSGTIFSLTPHDVPGLGPTYHGSMQDAKDAAAHQSKTYTSGKSPSGGKSFEYTIHEGGPSGKPVWKGQVYEGKQAR